MDWTAIATLIAAGAALLKVFWPKKSKSHRTVETVDADVLGTFLGLTDRVADLELRVAQLTIDLAQARKELSNALRELSGLRDQEEVLNARLHEKDQQIALLRARVAELEALCKRHGLDGDTV